MTNKEPTISELSESKPIKDSTWHTKVWVKRGAIIGVVVVAIAILVAIVVLLVWRASPEKALLDAVEYARTTPGSYVVKSADAEGIVTVKGSQFAFAGKIKSIPIDVIVSGSTVYLRSPSPESVYKNFIAGSPTAKTTPFIDGILTSLKDRWFMFNLQSMPAQSKDILTTHCVLDGKDLLMNNAASRQQLGSAYIAHPFVTIKTGNNNATESTYNVGIDGTKRTEFYKDFVKTGLYQSLTNCAEESDPLQNLNFTGTSVVVTLAQPDHVLKTVKIHSDKGDMTITANYASVPAIVSPSNAMSFDDIGNQLMKSFIGI